MPMV